MAQVARLDLQKEAMTSERPLVMSVHPCSWAPSAVYAPGNLRYLKRFNITYTWASWVGPRTKS